MTARLPARRSAYFMAVRMTSFLLNHVVHTFESCRAYVARLKQSGVDIALAEFPGAHHAYDGFTINGVDKRPQLRFSRNCHLIERSNGQILNGISRRPFDLSTDSCVEQGVTYAYDEMATLVTVAAVKNSLSTTLK